MGQAEYLQPPESIDPTTQQPRGISWTRWLLYAGGVLLVLSVAGYFWLRSYSTITVAADTTVLTAPLLADGYPDYVGYLNTLNSESITPENNAWIPLMRGMDSSELDASDRARHCKSLGIPLQALQHDAFQPFGSKAFRHSVPPQVLIAASAAGQLPWHVRFARSAAYNLVKFAEQTWVEDQPGELNKEDEFATVETDIPDLRPEALALRQPSLLKEADEIAEWHREQINNARDKLFEREEKIIQQRPWSRAECPVAAFWLDTQSAALDRLLSEMAARPKFYAPYLTNLNDPDNEVAFSILLPAVQDVRTLSQALQARAHDAMQRGDLDAAIRDFAAQLRVSTCYPEHPFLVDELVAISIHGTAMTTLSEIVFHPQVTAEQLAALAQRLEEPYSFPNFVRSLETERIAAVDYIVAIAARNKTVNMMPQLESVTRTMICWDDVLRRINTLYDRAAVAVKNRDWPSMQQLEQEIDTSPADLPSVSILPSQRTSIAKFVFPRLLMGSAFSAYRLALKVEVRHDLARVMLALERFRRANNAYPAALTALVPNYLPAVPTDPFDSKPLKYFRTPTGGYRAYSVWYNGTDDGGTPNVELNGGEIISIEGYDLVIGSPDEIPPRQNLAW